MVELDVRGREMAIVQILIASSKDQDAAGRLEWSRRVARIVS